MKDDKKLKIAIIEDDGFYASLLASQLKSRIAAITHNFLTGELFFEKDSTSFDVIILDLNLNSDVEDAMNGREILEILVNQKVPAKVIVLSSQEKIENAVEMLKIGAIDYIVKNRDAFDKLINSINSIIEFNKISGSIKSQKDKTFKIKKGFVVNALVLFIIIVVSFCLLYFNVGR